MRRHLRALHAPVVVCLAAAVVVATWLLVAAAEETVRVSPALLTSAAPALVAVLAAVVLRCPLGELASTTTRSGFKEAWVAAAVIWLVGTVAIATGVSTVGFQDLALNVLRSSLGFAALAVLGAVLVGPNGASGLAFGWLMCTVLISADSDQAPWMWNMPVTGSQPWACVGLVTLTIGTIVAAWLRRSDPAHLHSREG